MPSILMHVAISKLANETLKLNEQEFIIGSIIPDFGHKHQTHYYKESMNGLLVPDVDEFLKENKLDSALMLGKLSHLIADYEFFNGFINRFINYNKNTLEVLTQSGEILRSREAHATLEQDYDYLNSRLVKLFNLKPLIFNNEYKEVINTYNNLLMSCSNKPLTILKEDDVIEFINETSKILIKKIGEKHE